MQDREEGMSPWDSSPVGAASMAALYPCLLWKALLLPSWWCVTKSPIPAQVRDRREIAGEEPGTLSSRGLSLVLPYLLNTFCFKFLLNHTVIYGCLL